MSAKTIAVIGINGNQGGSVALSFLKMSGWSVRGITRSVESSSSKAWASKGVEIMAADIDNVESLVQVFRGAQVIFGVTNWWQELGVEKNRAKASQTGEDIRKICYDIEAQRGKNIVAAAATVSDQEGILEHLVLSVAPNTKGQSDGNIVGNYHFDAKWAAVTYLRSHHPRLETKTSLFQPGAFLTNWDEDGHSLFKIKPDGTAVISLPMRADSPIEFFHPNKDSGLCVKALVEAGPSKNLAAFGSQMSWKAVCEHLTQEFSDQNLNFVFESLTPEEYGAMVPGPAGPELAEMWQWMDQYGYYGSDASYIYPKDLGIDEEMTTVQQTWTKEYWTRLIDAASPVKK